MFNNYSRRIQPRVEFLNNEEIKEMHNASLRILERTGVVVHLPEVVEMLKEAGCQVSDGNRVRIPSHLVEEAIQNTPQTVSIYNRKGELALLLEDNKSFWRSANSPLRL